MLAKFIPLIVTVEPPEMAELIAPKVVITGASYENIESFVPTRLETNALTSYPLLCPGAATHRRVVSAVQLVVLHAVLESITEGLGSSMPKLTPMTEIVEPPVTTEFCASMLEMIGGSKLNSPCLVPTTDAIVILVTTETPVPAAA
jgi:hypothetical protein